MSADAADPAGTTTAANEASPDASVATPVAGGDDSSGRGEDGASRQETRRLAISDVMSVEAAGAGPLQPHRPKKSSALCPCPLTGGIVGRSYWFCGHRRQRTYAASRPNSDDDRVDAFSPCCLLGPNYGCFLATQLLIILPSAVFLILVGPLVYPALTAVAAALVATVLGLHYAVGCANPGILLMQTREAFAEATTPRDSTSKMSMCRYCNVLRAPGTQHCAECGVCVQGLDHHCPYMSKCVGKKTVAPFRAFNVMVMVLAVYLLVVR